MTTCIDPVRNAAVCKAWRAKNPAKSRASVRANYYRDHRATMLANARHRAKARGRVFNLTIEDIVVPETCPVLGIPIAFGHANRDNRPSIDRLDNARGYEKGNVRIISHRANRIKTNASAAELYAVAAYAAGL